MANSGITKVRLQLERLFVKYFCFSFFYPHKKTCPTFFLESPPKNPSFYRKISGGAILCCHIVLC